MKKRCAILTVHDPFKARGGVDSYTHQLVAILRAREIAVDIFHIDRLPGWPSEWIENLPLGSALRAALRRPVWKLHRKLRSWRPDGLFASGSAALSFDPYASRYLKPFYPLGRAFFSVDHRYDFVIAQTYAGYTYYPPRIPAFTVLHLTHVQYADDNREVFTPEWFDEVRSLYGLGAERQATSGNNHVIAVSEEVAQEARALYGAKNVTVVETGIDQKVFFPRPDRAQLRQKFSIAQGDFVAVFLGHPGPEKAVDVLQEVVARTPHVTWVLLLGGSLPCPLAPGPKLRIIRDLEPPQVAEALSMADALFHPARYEAFGLAMVEAMACGLPVVAAPVGVMRSIGREPPFDSVLLPSYGQGRQPVIDAAVQTIERLRVDPVLSRALRDAGPALVRRRFDHARWEREILSVLGVGI